MGIEKATFAGGCFWHIQLDFSQTPGVIKTTAGYTGGQLQNPTYKQVSTGKTGHVEAVELEYDPDKINYDQLLDKFFEMHNPTTLDKQGPDMGTQYNSAIFYHTPEQKTKAEAYKNKLVKEGKNVVTKINPAAEFYPAEEYHQDYLKKNNLRGCPIKL
jgi:peptide-methionine (S)-S-oxide reductase